MRDRETHRLSTIQRDNRHAIEEDKLADIRRQKQTEAHRPRQ